MRLEILDITAPLTKATASHDDGVDVVPQKTCSPSRERVGRLPSLLDSVGQVCRCGAGSSSGVMDLLKLPEHGQLSLEAESRSKAAAREATAVRSLMALALSDAR